jgi:pyruvate dehydrogenase E2 component (dihydrolipoamide acetyltransferase)
VVPVEGVLAELQPAAPEAGPAAAPPPAEPAASASSSVGEPVQVPPADDALVPVRRVGPIASPAARRLAREQGVELASVQGTGPGGRIVARDVSGSADSGAAVAPASADRLRDAVVRNITASWQQIPHVHIGGELVAEGLAQARQDPAAAGSGATVTDFLILALARALAEVPELNALRRVDGSVERSPAVHLSLAVATAAGVVAPVIRDAGSRTLEQVVRERRRLVEAARLGTIEGRDLGGGTCTLSNLGAHPVDFFAPVVSGPQVAMVATGRIADKVVAVDGGLGVRPRMWVNVAIDHRSADGEAGGRLLAALERQIAQLPGGLA